MRPFEEEFRRLNNTLLEMGTLVAQSVHRSVYALVDKNEDYAHQVIRDEARVDQMEIQIDDMAASLIVREQPVASDMRLVVAVIKIDTDLERMGDLAVSIVEKALSLIRQPPLAAPLDVTELVALVESMVLGCLDAFVKRDAEIARSVIASDDQVDSVRSRLSAELVSLMQGDPGSVTRALDYMTVIRSLERIADHTTNIAEEVIFLIQGIDVRHRRANSPEVSDSDAFVSSMA